MTSIQVKGVKGGRAYLPYAFTEQGIYMLMTVLRGDLAIRQSKILIRLFKGMKDFIIEREHLISYDEVTKLAFQTSQNTKDFGTQNEIIYLCGVSSKDAGKRVSSIMASSDKLLYEPLIKNLLKNQELVL